MSDQIKRFIIGHKFLTRLMYLAFRLKSGNAASNASAERKKISLFDYKNLIKDIPYSPEELVIDNNLYGQAYAIKRYASINHDSQAYIEHGLFWGGMLHQDVHYWYVSKFITFSERRKQSFINKGIEKKVICIGPYIHYAENLYNERDFQKVKSELGRTLLIFPSKSILNVESKYDVEEYIDEVKKIGDSYDSILVSLFFVDAHNKQITEAYEAHGFKIVTAGHRYDHHFLDRQRTIIELADMTMSNEVGTHVGYCIHLNKPHYIFKQKLERIGVSEKELQRELRLYKTEEEELRTEEKEEVTQAFSQYNQTITDKQRIVIDKYWGTSSIKTPEELKSILSS